MSEGRTFHNLALDRVHVGRPAAEAVALEVATRNASRVVVVVPQVIVDNTPMVAPIVEALGDKHAGTFTDLIDHVPRFAVFDLANFLREKRADLVVTIGGGTPMDTAKVALIALSQGIESGDDLGKAAVSVDASGNRIVPEIADPPCRQIIVPTTHSGAEFSDLAGCVDTETKVKQLFTAPMIGSASVILDPALCVHTPEALWLSTGVRAIDHAVETILSSGPEPIADASALHALRLFAKSLPLTKSDPEDLNARLDCQTAVWMACTGLNRTPHGASHGIGHQLGAVANVPHGLTSCVMLPHVMAFNQSAAPERMQWISEAMGQPDKAAGALVADLIASLGMPTTLRDVGVETVHFDAIADGAMLNPFLRANIKELKRADVIALLEEAY